MSDHHDDAIAEALDAPWDYFNRYDVPGLRAQLAARGLAINEVGAPEQARHVIAVMTENQKECHREIDWLTGALVKANAAIQKAAMAMGSADEWVDQESMIADFERRFAIKGA